MSLIQRHEAQLANSIENQKLFAHPGGLVLTDPDGIISFTINGLVSIVSDTGADISAQAKEVSAKNAKITLRRSTLLTNMGDDESLLPALNWTVEISGYTQKWVIEPGQYYPDEHAGIITYALSEVEEV